MSLSFGKTPFGKAHGNSKDDKSVDIDRAVRKIKTAYEKCAEQYGTKLFNLGAFEERYRGALAGKLNLNAFLHAEIMVLEELKKRVEGEKERGERRYQYSDAADRIIEKNLERVKKYRSIDFHPDAEVETRHLLGAAADFYDRIWQRCAPLLKTLRRKELADFVEKIENDFAYFVIPFRGSYSRSVDDYVLVLSRKNPKDNERAAVNFIRYGGILLNNCLKAMIDGLNASHRGIEPQNPRPLLERSKEILSRLIEDFRLQDIRGY